MFLVVLASGGSPAARVSDTGPLTASALVTIAIFAVLVIVGILYGVRQKRIRAAAEEDERQRAAELAAQDDAPSAAPAHVAPPAPAEPAAAERPATGTTAPVKPGSAPGEPAAESEPASGQRAKPVPPATDRALIDVKGLGPKAVPLLAAAGVTDLATLAALTPDRAAEVDGQLGALSGRLTRDRWVEQAKLLAAGDIAAFEATFGKL